MDASEWGFYGVIAGAIVGSLASVLTTAITGRNARIERQLTDSLERAERGRDFQRTNLLALQDVLAAHLRLIARAHFEDLEGFRSNPDSPRRPKLSQQLNQDLMDSGRRLSILIERIADNTLRESMKKIRSLADEVLMARSIQDSEERILSLQVPFAKTMEDLGSILRSTF